MAKEKKMGKSERLIAASQLIQAWPGEYTSEKLAEHFGVNRRTALRDIDSLRDLEFPVSRGYGGEGYRMEYPTMPLPVHLTNDEKMALKTLPKLASAMDNTSYMKNIRKNYQTAVAKMMDRLGMDLHRDDTSSSGLRVLPGWNWDGVDDEGSLMQLFEGIWRQRTIEMEYHAYSSGSITRRQFDPYYILPRHQGLYVIGYCHLRNDYRMFRVSRMRKVRCLSQRFYLEDDFLYAQLLNDVFGVDINGELITAVVRFPADKIPYVIEDIENQRSIVEQLNLEDSRVQLKIRAHLNTEFLRWVFQYGSDIDVVGPDSLLDEMRKAVLAQAARYLDR